MNVRTKLTDLRRGVPLPRSRGIDSPSTNAVTSTRSLVALTRAPITTSPAGSVVLGAGCKPLTIGERPGEAPGLAPAMTPPRPGEGDGGGGGTSGVGVGVAVGIRPPAIESVGGGIAAN